MDCWIASGKSLDTNITLSLQTMDAIWYYFLAAMINSALLGLNKSWLQTAP